MQPPAPQVSPPLAEKLRLTQPWLRFIAIIMLVGAGVAALGGLTSLVFGCLIMADLVPSASAGTSMHAASGAVLATFGAGALLMAVLHVFPALHLLGSAAAIRELSAGPSEDCALRALEGQRRYWQFAGVALTVLLSLGLLMLTVVALPAFLIFVAEVISAC